MNYQKLKENLWKYGRDNTYAYVHDGYKRELRQDKKYKQWDRLVKRVTFLAMSKEDRKLLQAMLEVRIANVLVNLNPQ